MNELRAKFRGCLLGAVLGDCIGAVYEGEEDIDKQQLNNFFNSLTDEGQPLLNYTDDTAMTRSLAASLIHNNEFNPSDCAHRFQVEFSTSPGRGYGANVVTVFKAWKKNPDIDVLQPAREQFDGKGSYGNGAAMRASPVALYCFDDVDKAKKMAKESALLTHTNSNAYNGAILQCLAVMQALRLDATTPLEPIMFLDYLITQMRTIEQDTQLSDSQETSSELPYCSSLTIARDLLEKEAVLNETVIELLGNNISALGSVPTAIFAFLFALRDIDGIESKGHFARTIHYAISLGGDTDTIATMAGAIAGAYLGENAIPEFMLKKCEGIDVASRHSDKLFELSHGRKE